MSIVLTTPQVARLLARCRTWAWIHATRGDFGETFRATDMPGAPWLVDLAGVEAYAVRKFTPDQIAAATNSTAQPMKEIPMPKTHYRVPLSNPAGEQQTALVALTPEQEADALRGPRGAGGGPGPVTYAYAIAQAKAAHPGFEWNGGAIDCVPQPS
jgi:hypothetical protein